MSNVNWIQEPETERLKASGDVVTMHVNPSSSKSGAWDWVTHIRGAPDASRHGTVGTVDDAKFCALLTARQWWLSQVETGWFR